jgi:hypothetical protein
MVVKIPGSLRPPESDIYVHIRQGQVLSDIDAGLSGSTSMRPLSLADDPRSLKGGLFGYSWVPRYIELIIYVAGYLWKRNQCGLTIDTVTASNFSNQMEM